MVTCSVVNCKNTSAKITKNKDGITFHRFPRSHHRRRQWEIAINREEDWTSTASSAICSEHFDTNDFYITESGLRRLSLNAVPVINISACQEPAETISNITNPNIAATDSEEVVKLKCKVRRLEMIADNRKRKISLLWQNKRRLKNKLEVMKALITHLIENKKDAGQTIVLSDELGI